MPKLEDMLPGLIPMALPMVSKLLGIEVPEQLGAAVAAHMAAPDEPLTAGERGNLNAVLRLPSDHLADVLKTVCKDKPGLGRKVIAALYEECHRRNEEMKEATNGQ